MLIGGRGQGKLVLALERTGAEPSQMCDGGTCPLEKLPSEPVLWRLHLLVRRLMLAGCDPMDWTVRLVRENPDILIVTDEIGCGIVPADRFERDWRETTGRICCMLAAKSTRVERVVAGIPILLKGERE